MEKWKKNKKQKNILLGLFSLNGTYMGQNWDKIGTDFLILFLGTIYITREVRAHMREVIIK